MQWLGQQSDADLTTLIDTVDTSALKLKETTEVNHIVKFGEIYTLNVLSTFAVSKLSAFIGIASKTAKHSLAVIYPGTDKPPLILSEVDLHTSALFLTISGQDYLAAAARDGIHLWNLANNTSSVVFQFKEQKDWLLCAVDDRTVACVAQHSASDRLREIYILNTDSQKFGLNAKICVNIDGEITDLSYVKMTDGTPCLLLNTPWKGLQCVEMIGGKVRWQVDRQKMGESFYPWSISTDNNTVFIANVHPPAVHLLSVEDGSAMTSMNLPPYGFRFPSCVRLQGDHLYVGHVNKEGTYCISKFTKPVAV